MTKLPATPQLPRSGGVKFGKPQSSSGHRVVLYGPGGIGKTSLASLAPAPVVFMDLDDSIARLNIASDIVENIDTWQQIRDAINSPGWDGKKTIVVDSITKAEELAAKYTCDTVPHEKGHKVKRIEDYGYGKGYQHVFETFLALLGDLDQHARAGRNVILICHDCTTTVPNPNGDDWLRYEPRLQSPASGKASIRLRVREWADHVLYFGYDIDVKEGKGRGHGSRTIYPAELPHCMAKSRTWSDQIPVVKNDSTVWSKIIK